MKILTLMCLALSFVFLTSCDDDGDKSSGQIELLSFGPSGIHHGDEIVFIGKNLDKVTSIVFQPSVEVPKSSFTSVTREQIKFNVPEAVETGKVVLKTPDGDIESKTVFSLEVPVVISDVTPEAKPGTNITITGDYINWIESVTFASNLTVEKANFVSQSQTEMVVTVPMEARTGFLVFATGGTEPLEITSHDPLTVTLPNATALNPTSIRHTDNLTIIGTDLDLVTKIEFGGGASVLKEDFGSQSETEIVVAVPATTTDGKLILTAPSGLEVETEDELTIILPNVTAFSPSNTDDHDPGVTLTMTGTDLDLVAKLTFPNVATPVTSFVSQSPTQIDVVIPAGAQGGTVVITTIHDYVVPIDVSFGDQLTLATVIYDDAVHAPLGAGGGWGGVTTDAANTENPRIGTKSVKVTYPGGWGGGCQFGNWSGQSVSTAGASFYAFSIFGGPGTAGKSINVNVAGKQVGVAIEEGAWKDVKIPLADFNSPAGISEIWFQDMGWSGTVYIDQIGLK
ncbi:MAG TPA: IPT/TIG domain-containing protein [Cyclobacteriaceae bacterium]|nr:IPT/TIG domain-containing protein [Cyclobacteriaceae bacterium]